MISKMESQTFSITLSKYLSLLVKICITFDILMLVFPFLLYDLDKSIGSFALLFWVCAIYALIGFASMSAIYILWQLKKGTWKKSIPFWLNGATLFILMLTPYISVAGNIRMKIELQINKARYQEITRKVDSDELQPQDEKGFIRLSPTQGDYVLANKENAVTSVFFDVGWSNLGLQGGNYSGFMYRSDDTPPPLNLMGNYWYQCEHEEFEWYYCTSL
jgi:hypothetical protein